MNSKEELLAEIQSEFPYGASVIIQGQPSPENNFLPKQFTGKLYYLESLTAFFVKWDGQPMTPLGVMEEGDSDE